MTEPNPNPDPKPTDPLDGLTDAQKAELQKRIDSAAATARRDGEKAGLTKAQQDAAAKAAADEEERKRQAQLAAGEFESVKKSLESERETVKGERDSLKAENERYAQIVESYLTEREKQIEGIPDLKAGYPKDASALERLQWLDDPRTKAAIAAAGDAQKVTNARETYRTPATPKPNGNAKPEIKPQPGLIF